MLPTQDWTLVFAYEKSQLVGGLGKPKPGPFLKDGVNTQKILTCIIKIASHL